MGNFHYIKHIKRTVFTGAALLLLTGGVLSAGSTRLDGFSATAQAASAPVFSTKRTSLYENGSNEGVYTYTVKNLKKGYKVKWTVTGKGAEYITLKKEDTKASGSKSSNKLTVDTLGARSAQNQKATLTARIYNKEGKLVRKVSDKFTLKVNSAYLRIKTGKITDNLNALSVNKAYDFDCSISPANATSKLFWKVTAENGSDYSSQITKDGIWTPTTEGSYTIEAYTKNSASGGIVTSTEMKVNVGSALMDIRQSGSNTVTATFSGNMKDKILLSDFSITNLYSSNSWGGTVTLQEFSLKEDGKTVILKTNTDFTDKSTYQLSYKGKIVSTFTASVGKPVSGVILSTEAPVNTTYDIEYALYDSNGMDVTSAYGYMATFSGMVPSGHISSNGKLFMDVLGEYASVTMTCHNGTESFTATANIQCGVEGSSGIRTMITNSLDTPVFDGSNAGSGSGAGSIGGSNAGSASSFFMGDLAYFHFQIYDKSGFPITVTNTSYSSQDTSIFTVSSNGQLIGHRAGTAMMSIYATTPDYHQVHYTVAVTVLPKRAPSFLTLSKNNITMSNAMEDDYKTELTLTAADQYRNPVSISNATATIREENGKAVLASYDRTTGRVIISAKGAAPGVYNYTISLFMGGSRVSTSFQLIVQAVPAAGLSTYLPELKASLLDTSTVTAVSGPLTTEVRLAHYINGVFAGYAPLQSATVKTSDGWYGENLTAAPAKKAKRIYPQDNQIVLNAAYWDGSSAKKATAGVYTVNLKYYAEEENVENDVIEQAEVVFVVK